MHLQRSPTIASSNLNALKGLISITVARQRPKAVKHYDFLPYFTFPPFQIQLQRFRKIQEERKIVKCDYGLFWDGRKRCGQ